ncbi:MAG: Lcl C-terminal domain-containing protein [Planctomycetota bacterium]
MVTLNTVVTALWAFWGANEAFHEGWYHTSLVENLLFTCVHLIPALVPLALGLLALRFPRIGAIVYIGIGTWLGGWYIVTRSPGWDIGQIVLMLMMGGFGGALGILWWLGRPHPKRWAYYVVWGIPLLVAVVSSAEPAFRVAPRFDDGDRGMRLVEGNGVRLVWAPQGPGWPREGMTWDQAVAHCRYLNEDGLSLADEPQDIWRLPTVEEIVRSLTRHGENAGGTWDAERRRASYRIKPDKESPLWDTRSPIVYWWAADEDGKDHAYRVVYNGGVWLIPKDLGMGSQAFRAVRDLPP